MQRFYAGVLATAAGIAALIVAYSDPPRLVPMEPGSIRALLEHEPIPVTVGGLSHAGYDALRVTGSVLVIVGVLVVLRLARNRARHARR